MNFFEILLRRAYDAFNERDLQAAIDTLHSDVEWANGQHGGVVNGRDSVRVYWSNQWKTLDPHAEPTGFVNLPGNRVGVDVRLVVHSVDGNVMSDETVRHVYSFQDSLIKSMSIEKPSPK